MMDTSNFKEMFTTDEVKQLRQRVAELEKERDELIEVNAAENAYWNAGFNVRAGQVKKLTAERDAALAELSGKTERLKSSLREALACGEDGDWQSARRIINTALGEEK